MESRNLIAITAAIATIGLAIVFAVFGVPAIARAVALQAPTAISAQLADSTLFTIDQVLDPSELDEARQIQLTEYFTRHAAIDHLEFRKANRLGANALTLSATTVVFTDELVELTDNDNELLAVYFHELGHARLRHVEQTILQNSAWLVLFTVMVGDFSGAGELLVSVPLVVGQMAYSRKLEREADQFAIDALLVAGLDPNALANILQKIVQSHTQPNEGVEEQGVMDTTTAESAESEAPVAEAPSDPEHQNWAEKVFEYLSTHPATEERLAHIRSFSRPEPAQSLGSE